MNNILKERDPLNSTGNYKFSEVIRQAQFSSVKIFAFFKCSKIHVVELSEC